MKKRILTALAAIALALGVMVATPSTASAGNGTNDFYLRGDISIPYANIDYIGIHFWATNWDYGSNQKYHLACSKSGSGYVVEMLTIGGLNMGTSCDQIRVISGHGRNKLCVTGRMVLGDRWTDCFYL